MERPPFLLECAIKTSQSRETWNKNKLVGQKPPLRPKDAVRDRSLFNLAIGTTLRGCDPNR